MIRVQAIRAALLVVLCCGLAAAKEPAWYPAQQAPQTSSSQSSQPASEQPAQQPGSAVIPAGQQVGEQPAQQPGGAVIPAGQQPVAPPSDDPRSDQPMQPFAPAESSSAATSGAQGQPAAAIPDTTPLNSPQQLTLGSAAEGRSYFTPSFRFTQYGMASNMGTGWDTMALSNVSGTAELVQQWTRSNMRLDWTTGGSIYPSNSSLTSAFHQFGLQIGATLNRWVLTLTDQGNYFPESAFGYFGVGAGGGINMGLGGQYVPNQSFLIDTQRLSNTAAATAMYRLTARSSLHFSGSYGILRFQGGSGGLENSDTISYSGGYDRTFGRNTLGVSYAGMLYTFGGSDTSIRTDSANLAFGRRITGRLAWQVSAGPQVRTITAAGQGTDTGTSWNLNTGLAYRLGRLQLNSAFLRSTTAGAGIFTGSETYQWTAGAARTLGRQWSGVANFGLARNSTVSLTPGAAGEEFQTEFVSMQISRVVSHEASLFLSYNFQHQAGNLGSICPGCGSTFDRHVFGAGFQWAARPLAFSLF